LPKQKAFAIFSRGGVIGAATGLVIVVLGMAVTEIMLLRGAGMPAGEWREISTAIGAGAIAISAVIGLVTFLALREMRLRAALQSDLRASDERLGGIIQSAMDAVITVDEEGRIVLFNAAAEQIFRCPASAAIGGPLERFIPERFRAAHRAHVEKFGATGTTTRQMGARLALYGLRADGAEFPIDASISQVTVEGRKLYTVILRDITDRKSAEEALSRSFHELREMSGVMHEVREAERTRIARELHDELAQWLTALKMDISWLSARLPQDPPQLLARAEKMKGVVDTTVGAVRRIAADLRPVMLDDLGLVPAIEHLLHEFSERSGVPVALDATWEGADFGEPLATAVYRMVQEALTNVARHARATQVRVTVMLRTDTLEVTVRDNGVGLREGAGGQKSYGLMGIRERARTLGGDATIYSPPEGGTVVQISIPLERYRGNKAAA
jgi:PAS domain S-box-containing protein